MARLINRGERIRMPSARDLEGMMPPVKVMPISQPSGAMPTGLRMALPTETKVPILRKLPSTSQRNLTPGTPRRRRIRKGWENRPTLV